MKSCGNTMKSYVSGKIKQRNRCANKYNPKSAKSSLCYSADTTSIDTLLGSRNRQQTWIADDKFLQIIIIIWKTLKYPS